MGRTPTEPKQPRLGPGVILDSSFARLRPSMAAFSGERTLSRPFGRRELSVMVETQSSCKKVVRRGGYGKESRP